jgi:SAM-dependent methyltransferase
MSAIRGIATALGIGSAWGGKALARAVAGGGAHLQVAALSEGVARALEAAGHTAQRAWLADGRLPLHDGAVDAVCVSGLPEEVEAALAVLRECGRVARSGGRVLAATAAGLARRGPERHRVTALFMHAGLRDLEQRMARGIVITSGRVG